MPRKFTPPSRSRVRTTRMRSLHNQQKTQNQSRIIHTQKIIEKCPEIKE